ncbi:hypothetical protein ACHAW5_002530 [Stephanodiscus triporus]|uniref:Fe2OG dioxygenase domain-containing protein n=1 Tax=Stephanodiscus triporus TaxID=2934178 RepID=A0ABD3QAB2_9STRA
MKNSLVKAAAAASLLSQSRRSAASFSPRARRTTIATAGRRTIVASSSSSSSSSSRVLPAPPFHPLGPPWYLSELSVGCTTRCRLPSTSTAAAHPSVVDDDYDGATITRLSSMPDVFLVRDAMSSSDVATLMDGANRRGMKVAGIRRGGGGDDDENNNVVRRGSYLTWIDPFDFDSSVDDDDGGGGPSYCGGFAPEDDGGGDDRGMMTTTVPAPLASVAWDAMSTSRLRFSHDAMNDAMNDRRDLIARAEDVQVARYDPGGGYDYHHDGYGRYLTVLTYLNGVGGTYFPYGDGDGDGDDDDENDDQADGIDGGRGIGGEESNRRCASGGDDVALLTTATSGGFVDEKRGILIVGKEGSDAYTTSTNFQSPSSSSVDRRDHHLAVHPKNIVNIRPGDAIAFYNYDIDGARDMRTLHCSLTVPEEKWIATCWFRSEDLTGPFGSLKKARMMDEWIAKTS